ncbi:MAG: hypothetical protein GC152_15825 [Alphaproteobacteria bacterium]|nr:hypothetical protein [Alphaproteobacteria bacterium]
MISVSGTFSDALSAARFHRWAAALLAALFVGQALLAAAHAHGEVDPAAYECAICHLTGQGDDALPVAPVEIEPNALFSIADIAPSAFDRIVAAATRAASARGPPLR